jgi:uncharacterized protein YbaR (Trm112 family)
MPINRKLLEILVCPVTKLPVFMLDQDKLARLNELIAKGELQTMDGEIINKPLQEALVTSNRNMIYRIENNIPIMLEDQGIASDQVDNW